nr:MAG TPA: hypothetical protein [Caudoviricetes sp.]
MSSLSPMIFSSSFARLSGIKKPAPNIVFLISFCASICLTK